MHVLMVIIFLWAACYSIAKGTEAAGRSVRGAYRKRLAAYAAGHPAKPGRFGAKVGAVASTAVFVPALLIRGFAAGFKAGWPDGKRKAREWAERRRGNRSVPEAEWPEGLPDPYDRNSYEPTPRPAPGPRPGPTPPPDPPGAVPEPGVSVVHSGVMHYGADDPEHSGRRHWGTQADCVICAPLLEGMESPHRCERCFPESDDDGERPRLHVVPDPDEPTDPVGQTPGTPNGRSKTMAIDSPTGGEVLSYDQLLVELKAIGTEATAELEDAQGDAQRAAEDATRIETMVASLGNLHLDEESLAEVSALMEPAKTRAEAAAARLAAAETRAAQAAAALDGIQRRHSNLAEAYAATDKPADQQFYTPV